MLKPLIRQNTPRIVSEELDLGLRLSLIRQIEPESDRKGLVLGLPLRLKWGNPDNDPLSDVNVDSQQTKSSSSALSSQLERRRRRRQTSAHIYMTKWLLRHSPLPWLSLLEEEDEDGRLMFYVLKLICSVGGGPVEDESRDRA